MNAAKRNRQGVDCTSFFRHIIHHCRGIFISVGFCWHAEVFLLGQKKKWIQLFIWGVKGFPLTVGAVDKEVHRGETGQSVCDTWVIMENLLGWVCLIFNSGSHSSLDKSMSRCIDLFPTPYTHGNYSTAARWGLFLPDKAMNVVNLFT